MPFVGRATNSVKLPSASHGSRLLKNSVCRLLKKISEAGRV